LSALILIVLAFVLKSGYCNQQDTIALNLATGNEKGVYFSVGKAIASANVQMPFLKINVLPSQGSRENLLLLSQNKASLCLAQSDIVNDAYQGLGMFRTKSSGIRAIASLYTEAVHILVRNPLHIRTIEDFKGKRICIGPEGGGTESNARAVLESAGITEAEVNLQHFAFDEAITAIKDGTVDIAFFTTGFPSEVVKTLMQDKAAQFYELNPDLLERLVSRCPSYVIINIPTTTYPNQTEDITTIGVPALLICRDDLSDGTGSALAQAAFLAQKMIHVSQGHADDVHPLLNGITIPINNGAKQYFVAKGFYRGQMYATLAIRYCIPLFILALLVLAVINIQRIRLFFYRREIARVLAALTLVWFFGSIVLYYVEHRINENYANILISFWSGLVNWINFGAKEPFTTAGKATSIIMTAFGLGGIAWLTGEIASIFVHKKLLGGKRMISKLEHHYVIINWNSKGPGIIDQLRNPEIEKRPILIITQSKDSPIPVKHEGNDIFHLFDYSIGEDILRKANVERAHSICVLAREDDSSADPETVLIILAIKKICNQIQVPIVAEIHDPDKAELARFVGGLGTGLVEIVSSKLVAQNLLAQVVVTPGLTNVYNDLLTFGENSMEIYGQKVPKQLVGKTFDDIVKLASEVRAKGIYLIPIAISRNGNAFVNPSTEAVGKFQENDVLFAICDSQKNLQSLFKVSNIG
jgi:TRAP transporter TAXI family solute receptor